MQLDTRTYRLTEKGKLGTIALIIGIIGLVASGLGYTGDSKQFFHSYLVAFVFWLTIALGALFFTMLHNLVDAKWSVVLRRLAESITSVFPIMAILAIPVLLGVHELYHWSHADVVAHDEILQEKAGYLNVPFFLIRTVFYFGVWILISTVLFRTSLKQDAGHEPGYTARFRKVSAAGMLLFAATSTFAAFDWLMSLDAHWYSTIFGVYVYSGSFLASLVFMILAVLYLRRNGVLTESITFEHYHDLAKLAFAFLIFWSYMAFSQYFLIWYANIPEETIWYQHRWIGSWKQMTLLIVYGHFVFPFVALMTRAAKRSVPVLWIVSIWVMIIHWVDLYWIVMPNLHHHGAHFSWIDLTTMLGIGGIFVWFFWRTFTSHPVVPVGDPGLEKSKAFVNM